MGIIRSLGLHQFIMQYKKLCINSVISNVIVIECRIHAELDMESNIVEN